MAGRVGDEDGVAVVVDAHPATHKVRGGAAALRGANAGGAELTLQKEGQME